MNKNDLIYITGAEGLVGSALIRKLKSLDYTNLMFSSRTILHHNDYVYTHNNYDLRIRKNVENIFSQY